MKHLLLAVTLIAVVAPSLGAAHSALKLSEPAHGSVIETAPEQMVLAFDGGMRLTSVRMNGDVVALPKQSGFVGSYALPLPELSDGVHQLEWRGLSEDGHSLTGTVEFTVR